MSNIFFKNINYFSSTQVLLHKTDQFARLLAHIVFQSTICCLFLYVHDLQLLFYDISWLEKNCRWNTVLDSIIQSCFARVILRRLIFQLFWYLQYTEGTWNVRLFGNHFVYNLLLLWFLANIQTLRAITEFNIHDTQLHCLGQK